MIQWLRRRLNKRKNIYKIKSLKYEVKGLKDKLVLETTRNTHSQNDKVNLDTENSQLKALLQDFECERKRYISVSNKFENEIDSHVKKTEN